MSRLVAFFLSRGLGARAAKLWAVVVAALAVVALLTALWGIWQAIDWWDDRQAVNADRDAANAEFLERQVKAEREASAAKADRDRSEAAEQDELEDEVDDAQSHGRSAADDVWDGGLFD